MRKFLFRLCVVSILLAAIPCHARLGESLDECGVRFGNPVGNDGSKEGDKTIAFKFKEWRIMITFRKGFAIQEDFFKEGQKDLTDAEITKILDADSGSMKWNETKAGIYKRDDGAFALLIDNKILSISAKDSMPKGF